MASNRVKALARQFYTWITDGGVAAGDPCLVGNLPGVAQQAKDTNNGATIDFEGAYALSVKGINDAGNSAVLIGDAIFYVTGDTPKLSKKASGVFFGTAIGPALGAPTSTTLVSSAATTTIAVRVGPSPGNVGAGNLTAGEVSTAALANGAVTGIKEGTASLIMLLAAGTTTGANVTVAGITAADELVWVASFTTAASIATVADRTSEYVPGAGVLTKSAGTNETNNQLLIVWRKHS